MLPVAYCLMRRRAPMLAPALLIAMVGCREEAESPTEPEPGPALDITAAATLSFRQVSPGRIHTCGVTTTNQAYCWGLGFLGHATIFQSLTPVAVAGGLAFRQVSPNGEHTCGVTTDNQAYCWGSNYKGELGIGTTSEPIATPVPVAGGLSFRQVTTAKGGAEGNSFTCGVTTDDRAYCWGSNSDGQLGDGTTSFQSLTPVAVAGGLRFRQLSAGGVGVGSPLGSGPGEPFACGVTTSDQAYCWGSGSRGQLGAGTTFFARTPVAVAGGLRFRHVSAGGRHTCGVTMANLAYCWGSNEFGQLGVGTTVARRLRPAPVAGGLRFRRVSAGGTHTCAVNLFDRAFCWGENVRGQLGDNTTTLRRTPVRVVGALRFRQVNLSDFRHTCGVTTGNLAYCWGQNGNGELGDGTVTTRRRPTPVAGAT